MEKKIEKNGITVIWNDDQIKDMFSVTNALYKILLPNKQLYYGSAELLADRIINHCTHINSISNQNRLFNTALKKYKTIKVSVVGEYETIDKAREAEKRFISKMARRLYEKLGNEGDFSNVVNKVLLNSEFYLNYS